VSSLASITSSPSLGIRRLGDALGNRQQAGPPPEHRPSVAHQPDQSWFVGKVDPYQSWYLPAEGW
jgi:hypothetical protein